MNWTELMGVEWAQALRPLLVDDPTWWPALKQQIDQEKQQVLPKDPASWFLSFNLCPLSRVRAVIIGQDPYINPNQAMGLCFSVPPGVPAPPSLRNIYQEMRNSGLTPPPNGDLQDWARRGVLLLNRVLTVRSGQSNSHQGWGWERLTDLVITILGNNRPTQHPIKFLLWGQDAQTVIPLINPLHHIVLTAAHPSPKSADKGFFGCGHLSEIRTLLMAGEPLPPNPVDMCRQIQFVVSESLQTDAMTLADNIKRPQVIWGLYGQPGVTLCALEVLQQRACSYYGYTASRAHTVNGGRLPHILSQYHLTAFPFDDRPSNTHQQAARHLLHNSQGCLVFLGSKPETDSAFDQHFLQPILASKHTHTVHLDTSIDNIETYTMAIQQFLHISWQSLLLTGSTQLTAEETSLLSRILHQII